MVLGLPRPILRLALSRSTADCSSIFSEPFSKKEMALSLFFLRGLYWGILARGRGSTDLAALGPYKNDRGPIFPSTARAS